MDKYRDKTADALCRACLELLKEDTLCLKHDIFLTPDLVKKFIVCTSLTVESMDGFPKYLCDCCYQKVQEFYQFQTMCVDAVQRFREILQQQEMQHFVDIEDEKPEFDLEAQAKLEITVTESDVLFNEDVCKDIPVDALEVDVLENVVEKPHKRLCLSTKTTRLSVLKMKNEAKRCKGVRKSTRNDRKRVEEVDVADQKNNIQVDMKQGTDAEVQDIDKNSWHDAGYSEGDEEHEEWAAQSEDEFKPQQIRRRLTGCRKKSSLSTSNKQKYGKRNVNRREIDAESARKSAQSYQCDICPTRFFVEHRLLAHKRSHDGLPPYPCTINGCDRGFNRWHCLSEHLKQHDGTNQWYTCTEQDCEKVYKHKHTLSMHLRKYHKKGPELKSHICEICGKVFKASAILNDHRYTHKDKSELPYACAEPDCDRRFSSKEKLKVHAMRHAGIKNYVCSYCGMRKTTRNELKIHINYHTLERRWPCRFCQHVCNSAGNLKMHVRTVHERAKDYACRFCERTFAKPDTRKYHEMTHTGEKPNECKECGKRFTQPAALRTHHKIHLRHRAQAVIQVQVPETAALNNDALQSMATTATITNAAEQSLCTSPVAAVNVLQATETHMEDLMQTV